MGDEADVMPGMQLPDLTIAARAAARRRPGADPARIPDRRRQPRRVPEAIHAIEPTRRRNGATSWRVFRDLGEDGRFVERFVIASWAEYVRLRTRMTMADRQLQQRVAEACSGPTSRSAYRG